jgi:hypothetical protein
MARQGGVFAIAATRRRRPSAPCTSTLSRSTPTTVVPVWICTPICCSRSARADRRSSKPGRIRGGPSQEDAVLRRVDPSGRGGCPGGSAGTAQRAGRPSPPLVAPAPISANVSHAARRSGSDSLSAISNAPKMRLRTFSASSIDFIPAACAANSSWPKYDCPEPAATMRLS